MLKSKRLLIGIALLMVVIILLAGCGGGGGGNEQRYTLTINTQGTGSVTPPSGGRYASGTTVTLTASSTDPHWVFERWTGDVQGTNNPTTVVMNGDKNVTAVFRYMRHALNISIEGHGMVAEVLLTERGASYDEGDEVFLLAEPDDGWIFDHWSGDLTGNANPATIIMNAEKNVTAVFVSEIPPDIPDDAYIISGSVAGDPDDPDKVRITLNAIINRENGEPVVGLTEENFVVVEDGVRMSPLEVSPVSSTSSKADIMFLIDISGSMVEEIAGVRNSVVAFANHLISSGVDVRLAGISFNEIVQDKFAFTSDVISFQNWVANLVTSGGIGGLGENDLDALVAAKNDFSWRSDAQHVIVLITDEPFQEVTDSGAQTSYMGTEVISMLVGQYVVHAISPNTESPDVKIIAEGTGGTWIQLPVDGNVDLTSLPLSETILSGYLIKFTSIRDGTDHVIHLWVKINDIYVADQTFMAHY